MSAFNTGSSNLPARAKARKSNQIWEHLWVVGPCLNRIIFKQEET